MVGSYAIVTHDAQRIKVISDASYCNELAGFYIQDGSLLHSRVQYTAVDYSSQLF
jgi:hypothetical protein